MRFPRPIRLPRERYAEAGERFHLTIHAHPEVASFPVPVRESISKAVMDERRMGRVELFAACLVPDHLHLLLRPDEMDVVRFMNAFKSWTTPQAWQ